MRPLLAVSLVPRPRPTFRHFQYGKAGRGPGIFSHVSDVRIERVVERVWLCVGALGPEQWKEPRYKVAYHTYLASGRRLPYTLSVECVVGWKYAKHSLLVRQIFATCWLRHAHVRKDTRLSPLFHTASDGKLGGTWERGHSLQYQLVILPWAMTYTYWYTHVHVHI